MIGTEEFFVGVGNVDDTIGGNDEVFVVVAIDAGFFVLVVEGFDVNSVFVVVNFVVVNFVVAVVVVVVVLPVVTVVVVGGGRVVLSCLVCLLVS